MCCSWPSQRRQLLREFYITLPGPISSWQVLYKAERFDERDYHMVDHSTIIVVVYRKSNRYALKSEYLSFLRYLANEEE